MDSDEDVAKPKKTAKFPTSMYITEGNKYLRLFKYDKAIEFFNTALEREPGNEKCLLGRSTCNLRLANIAEAKQDAEAALKANPKSPYAKMLIGEAEYFLGDFEKAFLVFYRGHTARPNYDRLRLGHQMCRRAIENALQPDIPITFEEEDISSLCSTETKQESTPKDTKDSYSFDLKQISKLLEDETIKSVHPDCEYLINYMKDRRVFWKTQNPQMSKKLDNTSGSEVKDKKLHEPKDNIELKASDDKYSERQTDASKDTNKDSKSKEITDTEKEAETEKNSDINEEAES